MQRNSTITLTVLLISLAFSALVQAEKFGIIIGISDYEFVRDLQFAAEDAKYMKRILTASGGIPETNVSLLIDKDATMEKIRDAINGLNGAKAEDTIVIYFSGHGYRARDTSGDETIDGMDEYILPWDAEENNLRRHISDDELGVYLDNLVSEHVLVILDSCYSAGVGSRNIANVKSIFPPGTPKLDGPQDGFAKDILTTENKNHRMVISASAPAEVSWEFQDIRHGLLTYHLGKAIEGDADNNKDGKTMIKTEAFPYIQKQITDFFTSHPNYINYKQTPTIEGEASDLCIIEPPTIEFTTIPPYEEGGPDTSADVTGKIVGMDSKIASKNYRVVLYVRSDRWYIQPTIAEPFTTIEEDGTWSNWTHTGYRYAALLVKPSFSPPTTTSSLPKAGGDVIAKIEVEGTK